MEGIAAERFPLFFLELIPNNIFSVMTTNSSIVSVVIIGAFFAASIRFMRNIKPDAIKACDEFLQSAQVAVNSVLTNVIKLMPYGISALVANTILSQGMEIISI
ncbi:MAG: cation:dicarboxylate symporter family transporter [Ruoffia tabacinasalis]|uniref:cation:dicarboxylate symporter family transporter n=1 Tax=unclassified Ruoffia TaxID=2862149 RepID=UPI0026846A56